MYIYMYIYIHIYICIYIFSTSITVRSFSGCVLVAMEMLFF